MFIYICVPTKQSLMILLRNITTFYYLYIVKGNKMYSVFKFLIESLFLLVSVESQNMSLNVMKKFRCKVTINGRIYCVVRKVFKKVKKE